MKAVGMTFFVLPHLARQLGPPTAACSVGTYEVFFPIQGSKLSSDCFSTTSNSLGAVLEAANATGLSVHLGLALQLDQDDPLRNETVVKAFAWLQWQVAQQLWSLATAAGYDHLIEGFYTEAEESNSYGWVANMQNFAARYFQPLGADIKTLRQDLLVWTSPYAVANRTRYPESHWVVPSFYGGMWEQTFAWAPALDVVALQDSTGALANSLTDVRELLGNVSAASNRRGRSAWTNVELFEVWPPTCRWPDKCTGRHPAPFSRIRAQLENEAPLLLGAAPKMIAWEWTSCLSPTPNNGAKFPDANRDNYAAYRAYVTATSSSTLA